MPRLSIPAGMPQQVADIVGVLGNHLRLQILRELALHDDTGMTIPEVRAAVGAPRSSIQRDLDEMEECARPLVQADVPRGDRRGRTVRWRIVLPAVEACFAELKDFATTADRSPGESSSPPLLGTSSL